MSYKCLMYFHVFLYVFRPVFFMYFCVFMSCIYFYVFSFCFQSWMLQLEKKKRNFLPFHVLIFMYVSRGLNLWFLVVLSHQYLFIQLYNYVSCKTTIFVSSAPDLLVAFEPYFAFLTVQNLPLFYLFSILYSPNHSCKINK